MKKLALASAVLAAAWGLSGCVSSGGGGSTISLETPAFVSARVDISTGTMNGSFNPAGYSDGQMRRMAASTCLSGGLSSFGTAPQDNGLTAFSATCANGYRDDARAVEFQRTATGAVLVEVTGASAGNLTYNSYEISV